MTQAETQKALATLIGAIALAGVATWVVHRAWSDIAVVKFGAPPLSYWEVVLGYVAIRVTVASKATA